MCQSYELTIYKVSLNPIKSSMHPLILPDNPNTKLLYPNTQKVYDMQHPVRRLRGPSCPCVHDPWGTRGSERQG